MVGGVYRMNLVDKSTALLHQEKILPIEETWASFKLNHYPPNTEQDKVDTFSFIKEQVSKRAGIYIYVKNENCLYVGKAKLLYDRMKSHYIESFSPVRGDTKDMRWHRFFSQYQGEVEVYWKEFQTEEERQLVEILLTNILKPAFLTFK